MVFAPVDPGIREKVISAYLAGHGRNQITRDLNEQGIKISHGSVSNFINAYKRQHKQPSQPQVCPESSDASISTGIPMNIGAGSSLLMARDSGIGKAAATINTNSNPNIIPRDGEPLSHFLNEDAMLVNPDSIIITNTTRPAPAQAIPPTKPAKPSRDLLIKDPEVNIESDANVINRDVITQNAAPEEFELYQPQSPLSDPEDPPIALGINWDSEEIWEKRFIRYVMDDKRWRQQQLQLIEQERQKLEATNCTDETID